MAETSGPIFRDDGAVEVMLDNVAQSVAEELEFLWLANLDASIRVNHHVYTSNVVVQREPPGWKVTDGGVVYGPWLEGTGSRNETTRFRGYFSLRRALAEAEATVPEIAEVEVSKFVAKMNA